MTKSARAIHIRRNATYEKWKSEQQAGKSAAHRLLFPTEEANTCGERPPIKCSEGEELGRVDVVVDQQRITVIGNVVEAPAYCPEEAEQLKTLLQLHIKGEVGREPIRTRGSDDLLLFGRSAEGKAGASFQRVRDIQCMNDGQA